MPEPVQMLTTDAGGRTTPLGTGQTTAANSLPVVLASDQSVLVEQWSFFDAMGNDVDIAVKTSPGALMSVFVTNENAAVRFLQLHDKASAPVNPNAPILSLPIPAGTANNPGTLLLPNTIFGQAGRICLVGVSIGISTTEATFTAATATEHSITGAFV